MLSLKKYVWLLLLGLQGISLATVWEVSPWTDDASTGLDPAQNYTHAINNSSGESVVVNGIAFTNNWGDEAEDWSLDGWGWIDSDSGNDISGDSYLLSTHFRYGNSNLTLTGLVPGDNYVITLFSVAWEDGTRTVTLTDSYGSFVFNQDMYGNNKGIKITGIYQANENGEFSISMVNDFHFYAFANCNYTGITPMSVHPEEPAQYTGGNRVSTESCLSWADEFTGSDNDYAFDVYFDPNELLINDMAAETLVVSGENVYSYVPELAPGTQYFWRIIPYDAGNEPNMAYASEIRSFMTSYEEEYWTDEAWTSDADIQVSVGKYYTHKVNFQASESAAAVVNGVSFENDNDHEGMNWALVGANEVHENSDHNIAGDGGTLVSGFYLTDPAELTLTGLTPGTDYIFTELTRGWGEPGTREVNISTSVDGRVTEIDENMAGNNNGRLIMYRYTAPAEGEVTFGFDALTTDTWHHYAFTNEIAFPAYADPAILPGSSVASDVVLSWITRGDIVSPTYNVTVATDEAMTTIVDSASELAGASFDPDVEADQTYYWQVEIAESGEVVYTSPVWSFVTSPKPEAVKVIEWKFDETAGYIAEQTGPTEDADGILTGYNDPTTAHVQGLVNNALKLNGIDEFVNVSNAYVYMPTASGQDFAISGYFCTYDNYGPIFSMRNSDDENPIIDIALGYNGVTNNLGQVVMVVRDNDGSARSVSSGIPVNDGRWHNLVVTRVGDKWAVYIDGELRTSINGAATGEVSLNFMAIGASLKWLADNEWEEETHYRFFKGLMDEFYIWEGELLPSQIAEMAAIIPTQGDVTVDTVTDMADIAEFADNWLGSTMSQIQPTTMLEDMEAYTNDPNSYKENWPYTPEDDFSDLVLSVVSDPNTNNKYMQMDYDFSTGGMHGHIPVKLLGRGAHMGLFDRIDLLVRKAPGCELSRIILDFDDARGISDPTPDDIYNKGRIVIDIAEEPEDEWIVVSGMIPGNDIDLRECTDLYGINFSIEDGGADTGTIYIDTIELADGTLDCILDAGVLYPDLNGDCNVNILDFAAVAQGWLSGQE